ncbi:hypothetical protein, partial [Streptomyces chattanoogensis]|uniref:hypothetical protein n=1 Tax=Streptomyces chattanoogensis TaxID=66876 RepID=UPI001B80AA2E
MKLERRRGRVSQEAAVYWCYDQARNLLYAGMMFNPGSRPPDRLRRAEWWPLVDERYTKVVWYPTRWDAQVALSNT